MLKPIIGILAVLLISGGLAWAGSQGSVSVPLVPLFAICASIGFLLHWIVFVPSFIFQTEHYFDLVGSISYIATVAVAAAIAIGMLLWVVGFAIEVIADQQKTKFRKNPDNAEKFITTGLWAYSRHPNYFGEIVLWLGIGIIALPTLVGWQYMTLISPIFVIFLLVKISGVRLLEEGGQKRWGADPAYQQYIATTSTLILLPKKS